MNSINIPFSFLTEKNIVLSAKEVDFAINHEIIYLADLSQIVDSSLLKYPDDKRLLDIALSLLLNESYKDCNIKHSQVDYDDELKEDNRVYDKWRYILLLWLYENRQGNSADYDEINIIHADFNYPSDMENFINYMPAPNINEKSGYENIFNNWLVYLNTYRYLIET